MKKLILYLCAFLFFTVLVKSEEEKKFAEVREIKPFWYCCIEMTGSYEQHGEAFQRLYEQAGAQGFGSDFAAFGIYYNAPSQVAESELKWEIGFELKEKAEVQAPLVLKEWQHELLAVTLYEGSFSAEAFGAAHQKLFEWIVQNNYTPAGPSMEKYITMPTQNSDGEWAGTIEILLPVQKK